jgi:DNA polymerase-3 subunit beta
MNLTLSPSEVSALLAAVTQAARVIDTRSTIPALGHIHLQTETRGESSLFPWLLITTTNLESGYRAEMRLAAKSTDTAEALLPCVQLLRILRTAPNGKELTLTVDKDHRVTIASGDYRANLPGLTPEDFPDLSDQFSSSAPGIDIPNPHETFLPSLRAATRFASADETRYVLTGLHLVFTPGEPIVIQGTDGRRLAQYTLTETLTPADSEAPADIVIPADRCGILAGLLENYEDPIHLQVGPGYLTVHAGDIRYYTKLIDGTYPNVSQVIPQSWEEQIKLTPAPLLESLQRVGLVTDKQAPSIRISMEAEELTLSATSDLGQTSDTHPLPKPITKPYEAGFSLHFLTDALKAAGETVTCCIPEDSFGPFMMLADLPNHVTLHLIIMPMRLQ